MSSFARSRSLGAASLCVFLAACGGGADDVPQDAAPADEPAIIDERQDNYEAMSDAFKAIRSELEGGSPDLVFIQQQANDINERAQKITGYFPEGTGVDAGYDTEALATIWEKPAEFETAAQNLVDASAQLAMVAGEGDAAAVAEQAKEMGGTCKACHDQFRLDDD